MLTNTHTAQMTLVCCSSMYADPFACVTIPAFKSETKQLQRSHAMTTVTYENQKFLRLVLVACPSDAFPGIGSDLHRGRTWSTRRPSCLLSFCTWQRNTRKQCRTTSLKVTHSLDL